MERKISFNDVQKAVEEAYQQFKSESDGTVDSRVTSTKAGEYAISVVLTDGRRVDKGDVDSLFPLGEIAKLPVSVVLLSQNSAEELVKKSGTCCCKSKDSKKVKPDIPLGSHGLRAVSAVVPQNDPEGKYSVILNQLVDLAGSEPVLDDALYETLKKQAADADTVNKLAEAEYYLYDDSTTTIDLYTKLLSLRMSAKQLADMGATVAADGRNPLTGEPAFDGKIAASVVTLMGTRGMHHNIKAWMMTAGVPARTGFGGGVVAVMPGFGAIVAYAPELNGRGVSEKAAKTVRYIANALGLNVFASARVSVE